MPFSVHNFLEVFGIRQTDLSAVFLSLQLEFDVQREYLGILELLWLLLETCVGEGLLEADSFNEEGVSD